MGVLKALRQRLNRGSKRQNPSVADYGDDENKLIAAMGGRPGMIVNKVPASRRGSDARSTSTSDRSMSSFGSSEMQDHNQQAVEWTLPLVDTEVTEPQSMEEEIKRLKALNDYFVLDADGEIEFDRITTLASQIFDVPIALISLVDLGRQWFLSKVGLDASETPRKHAFCAHVILNKYKLLVVPDATKDFRFQDNPLVKEGLKIRFYAGAALVSPEGYKLGTLCIVSPVARPEGLSPSQQAMLHDMAAMVISALVARRNRLLKDDYENRFLDLAKILMDTNKSLETSKATLEAVVAKQNMDSEDGNEVMSVARSLGFQSKICMATMKNVLQDTGSGATTTTSCSATPATLGDYRDEGFETTITDYDNIANANDPTTDMVKVFENINALIPTFSFDGIVTVDIDKSVPHEIVADDLLLFRSIFNMLTHCMGQSSASSSSSTSIAPEYNHAGLRIRRMKRQGNELLVQCLKPGAPMDTTHAKELFGHKDSLLSPVASMVRSMGGRFGMFEGKWNHQNGAGGGGGGTAAAAGVQSIFWFQIPYELPAFALKDPSSNTLKTSLHQTHIAAASSMVSSSKKNTAGVGAGAGSTVVTMDPFQAALLEAGCGGRGR